MNSLWRYVHATSNSSSSAARYVLTVWFQLKPSTGFIRCEITTNIKHVLPALLLEIDLQWCLVEGTACPHSSSYLPSKLFSCLADQRFSQPHHCFPQWLASVFLTSSLYPTTAREQQNVGDRFGQTQHCSALLHGGSRRIDRVHVRRYREQLEIFSCRVPFTSLVHFTPTLPPLDETVIWIWHPVSRLGLCGKFSLPRSSLRPDGDVLNQ